MTRTGSTHSMFMSFRTGALALACGLLATFLVRAQEGPPPKKVPPELIKEVPDVDLKKGPEEAKGESPKEIIDRLHKNMIAANDLLKDKADPTEETQKLQQDIINDLDKLINQQQENESKDSASKGGGGGAGSETAKGGGKPEKSKGDGKPKPDEAKKDDKGGDPDKKDTAKGKDKEDKEGMGEKDKKEIAKGGKDKEDKEDDKKDMGKGGKEGKDSKDAKDGGGGGGKSPDEKTVAKTAQKVWGEYRLDERLKSDAHPSERMLPRYERLLERFTIKKADR